MNELIEFQRHRITALQNRVAELETRKTELQSFILELSDKDCPSDYKRVISNLILQE
jgi:hypothetical protein